MSTAELLPLPVVIPLTGALLSPIVGRIHGRIPLIVGVASMASSLALLAVIAGDVYSGNGHVLVHFFSAQKPDHGQLLGIAFAADPFGLAFAILTAGIGLLLLLSLLSEFGDLGKHELGWLAALAQLLLAALIASALTADTVNLFVWFEVAALASYGLTGFFLERPIALEAAFKILVLTSMASFMVFVGAAVFYDRFGALSFAQLHNSLQHGLGRPAVLALALTVAGFATKAGLAPWHGWLPDAHTPVPGGISALFSGLMVNLGIVGLVRFALLIVGPHSGHPLLGLLTALGLASALLGALLALAQDDLKRLLAWDTVSQMGVLIVGFASSEARGEQGAIFHLVNHALFKSLLFLCAGSVVHATGVTKLSEMGGLLRRRPLTTVAFTVGAMSIGGVPGFNGYVSLGLIHEGLEQERAVWVLMLLAQVITVAALARAAYLGFYRRRDEPYEHMQPARWGMRVSLATLAVACVGLGVVPYLALHGMVEPAASLLDHPGDYASAVLAGGGSVPHAGLEFSYGKASDLALAAVEIALGLALAALYLRARREPRLITALRRLHTGSVNDYAGFAAGGLALSLFVLLA